MISRPAPDGLAKSLMHLRASSGSSSRRRGGRRTTLAHRHHEEHSQRRRGALDVAQGRTPRRGAPRHRVGRRRAARAPDLHDRRREGNVRPAVLPGGERPTHRPRISRREAARVRGAGLEFVMKSGEHVCQCAVTFPASPSVSPVVVPASTARRL